MPPKRSNASVSLASSAAGGSSTGAPKLAHVVAYAVAEAVTRFSATKPPVSAKVVKQPRGKAVQKVPWSEVPEDARSVISQLDEKQSRLQEDRKSFAPKIKEMASGAKARREQLKEKIKKEPSKARAVNLSEPVVVDEPRRPKAEPARAPSAPSAAQEALGRLDESMSQSIFSHSSRQSAARGARAERDAGSESEEEDEEEDLFGDRQTVLSQTSFVITGREQKKAPSRVDVKTFRRVVLESVQDTLAGMGYDPHARVRESQVRAVLGDNSFWDRFLSTMQERLHDAKMKRKVEDFVVSVRAQNDSGRGADEGDGENYFAKLLEASRK